MSRSRFSVPMLVALLGSTLLVGACAQEPFNINFPRNDRSAIRQVIQRLSKPVRRIKNAFDRPMAFIVATRPRGILALDLQTGKVLWRKPIRDTSSKLVVGRNYIFHRKGSTIIMARHIRTGEIAWQFTFKYGNATQFFGLAADGDDLYYVVTSTLGTRRTYYARWADVVKMDGKTGKVLWRKRATGALGAPAVRNGLVFIPYRFQFLSILDGKKGEEVARLYVKHMASRRGRPGKKSLSPLLINYAWATPEGVFYGDADGDGVFRLSMRSASGRKKESDFISVPLKKLRSVHTRYFWNRYSDTVVSYTAIDRNRLLWRPEPSGARFVGNRVVLQYYRYLFGFDADRGVLKWAYVHPATQVISSLNLGERVIYLSREGRIVMVDTATGDRVWELDTGIRSYGGTFDCHGFAPARRNYLANKPLLTVLKGIVREPEIQLSDVKIFAISQLVKVKGVEITKILLDIVNSPQTPATVRRMAGRVLVKRAGPDSLEFFLKALEARYDFLKGEEPKGVGVVAQALARIGDKRAVPPLLAHLKQPFTPYSALEEVVHALVRLGDKRIVWPMRNFLLTYRAEPAFRPQVNILTTVAKALLTFGGRDERQLLTFVAEDRHTLAQLKQYIQRELGRTRK